MNADKHCKKCRHAGVCIVYIDLEDLQATDKILEELAKNCKEFISRPLR